MDCVLMNLVEQYGPLLARTHHQLIKNLVYDNLMMIVGIKTLVFVKYHPIIIDQLRLHEPRKEKNQRPPSQHFSSSKLEWQMMFFPRGLPPVTRIESHTLILIYRPPLSIYNKHKSERSKNTGSFSSREKSENTLYSQFSLSRSQTVLTVFPSKCHSTVSVIICYAAPSNCM